MVCGGGPTGVELAGGLAELTHEVLARDFGFDSAPIRITLLQRSTRLLPSFHSASSRYTPCALERRGVSVRTGVGVSEVGPDRVVLDTGEVLRACTVVWCAGVRASSLALTAALHVDRSGRTLVHGDLSVPAAPDTHVIGDAAGAVDGTSHPQLATVAIQQGAPVADQIRSRVAGGDTTPFHYRSVGSGRRSGATRQWSNWRADECGYGDVQPGCSGASHTCSAWRARATGRVSPWTGPGTT